MTNHFNCLSFFWSDMAAVWVVQCSSSLLILARISRGFYGGILFGRCLVFVWWYLSPSRTQNHIGGFKIMFVLNILILVWVLMLDDFQMFRSFAKLARAFVILYWTSMVESPLILLPRYTKSLMFSTLLLLAVVSLSFFDLVFIILFC